MDFSHSWHLPRSSAYGLAGLLACQADQADATCVCGLIKQGSRPTTSFRRSLRRATIMEIYWGGRTQTRSGRKSSLTLHLFACAPLAIGRNWDQVFRVSIWAGKGVLALSAGAAMTHGNFLRTVSPEPRIPTDAAAFPPIERFASSLLH
jgi:hypothetical protein